MQSVAYQSASGCVAACSAALASIENQLEFVRLLMYISRIDKSSKTKGSYIVDGLLCILEGYDYNCRITRLDFVCFLYYKTCQQDDSIKATEAKKDFESLSSRWNDRSLSRVRYEGNTFLLKSHKIITKTAAPHKDQGRQVWFETENLSFLGCSPLQTHYCLFE